MAALRRSRRRTPTGRIHPRARQLSLSDPYLLGQVSKSSLRRVAERDRKDRELSPESWQALAYNLTFEKVGELAYVVNLKAGTISRGSLKVVEWDPETGERIEEEDSAYPKVWEAARSNLRKLRGEAGDYHAILRDWSVHDQVAGEAHLVGEPIDDTDQISWSMLSVLEVREERGKVTRIESVSPRNKIERALDPEGSYIARYHRPDPRHSDDAVSMIKRVIDVATEIARLDDLIKVMISGRLPADLLIMPQEVKFDDETEDEYREQDEDGIVHADSFEDALAAHMDAPSLDPSDPAAYTPLVARVPGQYAKEVRLQSLSTDRHSWAIELREQNVHRLGRELDIPPEVITGKGGLNDWSAFNVDQDFIIKHVIEDGERGARFFSTRYLRKLLVAEDDIDPQVAARFEYEYDPSTLVANADETANARAVFDRGELSTEKLLKSHGFDPEVDRPTDEEKLSWAFFRMMRTAGVSALNAGVFDRPAADAGIDLAPPPSAQIAEILDAAAPAEDESPVGEQIPADSPSESAEGVDGNSGVSDPSRASSEAEQLVTYATAAAETGVGHVMTRARNRIDGRADKIDGLRDRLAADPAATLSPVEFEQLGLPLSVLTSGAFDPMRRPVSMRVQEWLLARAPQLDPWEVEELADKRTEALCRQLEMLVARELTEGPQPRGRSIAAAIRSSLLEGA